MNVRKMFLFIFCFLIVWGYFLPFANPQWNAEFFEGYEMILNYKIKYTGTASCSHSTEPNLIQLGYIGINVKYRDNLEIIFEGTLKNFLTPISIVSSMAKEKVYYFDPMTCTNSYTIGVSGNGYRSEIEKHHNKYCTPKEYTAYIYESNWNHTKKNRKEIEDEIGSWLCHAHSYGFEFFIYTEITDKHSDITYFITFGDERFGFETGSGERITDLVSTMGQSKYESKLTLNDSLNSDCDMMHGQDSKSWEGFDPLRSWGSDYCGTPRAVSSIYECVQNSSDIIDIREIFREKLRNNPTTLKRTGFKVPIGDFEFPYSYTQNGITCIGKDEDGEIPCGILGTYEQNEKNSVSGVASLLYEKDKSDRTGKDLSRGTVEISYTLSLNPPSSYEVLIKPPKNLKDWLPKGGRDDNSPGDVLKFTGQVSQTKESKGKGKDNKVNVTFDLESSKEPGICMNYPPKEKATDKPDLMIITDGTSKQFRIDKDGSKAEGEFKVGDSFTLAVGSFDYGGYGKLNVSSDATVRIEGYPNATTLPLPRDDNNNHVADSWEEEMKILSKNLPADWDGAENPKGQKSPGDGISLYEKYRGFDSFGIHERLDTHHKYLFVHDPNGIVRKTNFEDLSLAPTGFGLVSGLRIRYVDDNHWTGQGSSADKKRIINFNHGWGHAVDQHALSVVLENLYIDILPTGYEEMLKKKTFNFRMTEGYSFPDHTMTFGSPQHTYQITVWKNVIQFKIDIHMIDHMANKEPFTFKIPDDWTYDQRQEQVQKEKEADWKIGYEESPKDRKRPEYAERILRQVALVTSHEMGHGVGIRHHNSEYEGDKKCVMRLLDPDVDKCPKDPEDIFDFKFKYYNPWPNKICKDTKDTKDTEHTKDIEHTYEGKGCWAQIQVSDRN